jgi:hypothetical protein
LDTKIGWGKGKRPGYFQVSVADSGKFRCDQGEKQWQRLLDGNELGMSFRGMGVNSSDTQRQRYSSHTNYRYPRLSQALTIATRDFMTVSRPRHLLVILACCLQLVACGGGGGDDSGGGTVSAPNPALAQEAGTQADYDTSQVTLQGILLDQTGAALAGASVSVAGLTVTTGADGSFELATLARENALMSVAATGQRTEYIPVYLNQPATVGTITPSR